MGETSVAKRPLVVHVIYRLAIGGMENGLVNLINFMPVSSYRHVIVCLADYTEFKERIERDDVTVYALHKRPGHELGVYIRFWRLLRKLKPAIVHTRNLGALEFQIPALLAGVKHRVQSEHGRDSSDLKGERKKYLRLRRMINPIVNQHIALSRDLEKWLEQSVKVNPQYISQIYNGVDINRFTSLSARKQLPVTNFAKDEDVVIGTVGRMRDEKDQLTLVRAFLLLLKRLENTNIGLRLIIIGDGPLRDQALGLLREANAEGLAWLPGDRNDVPELLQSMDIFVLPSLIEGISNTILEAMASGLPVVATDVGGNPELIEDGITGKLIESASPEIMADAIEQYINSKDLRRAHGNAGRERVKRDFSIENMVKHYLNVYDSLIGKQVPEQKSKPFVVEKKLEKELKD